MGDDPILKEWECATISEERRNAAGQTERWVPYPAADRVLAYMGQLIDAPNRAEMDTLLVTSPANNGKTAVVERFRGNPRRQLGETPAVEACPVLYIYAPPAPNPRRFLDEILLAVLNEKLVDRESVDSKIERIARGFDQAGAKVLVIDDIHHAMTGSHLKESAFFEMVYRVKQRLGCGLVLVGMPEARILLHHGELAKHSVIDMELPLWRHREDYLFFLEGLKQTIPLKGSADITEKSLSTKILQLSEGLIGEMVMLVEKATIRAIMTGTERITLREIQEADYTSPAARTEIFNILRLGLRGEEYSHGPAEEGGCSMGSQAVVASDLQCCNHEKMICRIALAEPLRVFSFESFKTMCTIKYDDANQTTFKTDIGCQNCETGLAIKEGRRTILPDNVPLIEALVGVGSHQGKPFGKAQSSPENTNSSSLFTPSHLNIKPIPAEQIQGLTLAGLREFFVLPLMLFQEKGQCPVCQRAGLKGVGYGVCGRCYGVARDLQGIAMLQALEDKIADDKAHPGMKRGPFGRLILDQTPSCTEEVGGTPQKAPGKDIEDAKKEDNTEIKSSSILLQELAKILKPLPKGWVTRQSPITLRDLRSYWVRSVIESTGTSACPCCGSVRRHKSCGLCSGCYDVAMRKKLSGVALLEYIIHRAKKGEAQKDIKKSTDPASEPSPSAATSAGAGSVEVGDSGKFVGLMETGAMIAICLSLGLNSKTPLHEIPVHIDRLIKNRDALVEQRDSLQEDCNEQLRQLAQANANCAALSDEVALLKRILPGMPRMKSAEWFLSSTSKEGEPLADVLQEVIENIVNGDAYESHGDIARESKVVGFGFPAGMARNKIQEAVRCHQENPDLAIADLMSAIVHTASLLVAIRANMAGLERA